MIYKSYITCEVRTHPLHPAGWSDIVIRRELCTKISQMRWRRHRTIILVNIIYYNCIIATTILLWYTTTTRFHIPTVVVVLQTTTLLLPPLLLLLPIFQSATLLIIVHDLYIPAAYKYKEISITESNVS